MLGIEELMKNKTASYSTSVVCLSLKGELYRIEREVFTKAL